MKITTELSHDTLENIVVEMLEGDLDTMDLMDDADIDIDIDWTLYAAILKVLEYYGDPVKEEPEIVRPDSMSLMDQEWEYMEWPQFVDGSKF